MLSTFILSIQFLEYSVIQSYLKFIFNFCKFEMFTNVGSVGSLIPKMNKGQIFQVTYFRSFRNMIISLGT